MACHVSREYSPADDVFRGADPAHSTAEIPCTTRRDAIRLTEYVAAVGVHATSLPPGQERTEVEAWLAFADAHLQNLTESASAPKLPTPPKPSGDDLKPFLGHWSPYGPRSC
ncbi:hypothetical protein GCM10010327_03910 [Streptomyces nitrosporeus]|nr:hypothetical protein GCM10010327_03910 [Streptomyces nitrosporeus]